MAAGLPVVASDWDGYRYTVRDGIEGFLVPTLGGPTTGLGASMVARHLFQIDSYQAYAGTVAQHTAVHIGRCAQALAELIRSPELRRRMGQAGRERIRMTFDWPVIARQVRALVDDLGRVRAAGADPAAGTRLDPVKGDPFADFAGFASQTLGADTRLSVPDGITQADVLRAGAVQLDAAFRGWRGTLAECARAFELVASGQAGDVRQVLLAFPAERRAAMEISLAWMAKLGWLDWLD
jgi:hypothetical protein